MPFHKDPIPEDYPERLCGRRPFFERYAREQAENLRRALGDELYDAITRAAKENKD